MANSTASKIAKLNNRAMAARVAEAVAIGVNTMGDLAMIGYSRAQVLTAVEVGTILQAENNFITGFSLHSTAGMRIAALEPFLSSPVLAEPTTTEPATEKRKPNLKFKNISKQGRRVFVGSREFCELASRCAAARGLDPMTRKHSKDGKTWLLTMLPAGQIPIGCAA